MKTKISAIALIWISAFMVLGQSQKGLNLSTRWTGKAPAIQSVSSVSQWLQNPMNVRLEVAVTNLYADTNAYLEINVGSRRLFFYGAGVDDLGNYIPTNYSPVEVDISLRRQYAASMICPNSGPNGSPLFQLQDVSDAYDLGQVLSTSGPPAALSAFLWASFSPGARYAITNDDPNSDPGCPVAQTNLVEQLNQVITSGPLNTNLFTGVTFGIDTSNLLVQNPQGQSLVLLNRLLLRDAYYSLYYWLPGPSQPDLSGTAQVTFSVKPPDQYVINPFLPQANYSILVDGPDTILNVTNAIVNLLNPGTGYLSTNYSTLQVSESTFANFGVGDGCDDPTPAPGTGQWLKMGPGCTADTNAISLEWSVSLGRTFDGIAAGNLTFNETELSSDSYTPDAIFYDCSMTNLYSKIGLGNYTPTNLYSSVVLVTTNFSYLETNGNAQVYTNFTVLLRQVKSYQSFVDILTPDTNNTVLNFYLSSQVGTNQDQNGLYTNISGSPFVTWTLQNPSPGSATGLNIIEDRNGNITTQSLAEVAGAGGVTWTLTQGSGSATRVESRQVSFAGSPVTNRIELDTISYGSSGPPAYQCYETYNFYPWGSELVETRIPNNPDYITTYSYYNNDDPVYDPDDYGYSKINTITYPDGYWEKRVYEDLDWDDYYNVDFGLWVYGEGLLCYAFHPYLDGQENGATTPNTAWFDNTIYTEYGYPDTPGSGQGGYDGIQTDYGQSCATLDGIHREESYGDLFDTYGTMSTSSLMQQPEGPCTASWSGFDVPAQMSESDATRSECEQIYADQAVPGLAKHPFWNQYMDNNPDKFYYYDHGIYDPSSGTFSINPTNHLFVAGGCTNQYPDYRQTCIDFACINWLYYYTDDDQIGDYTQYFLDFYNGYLPQGDTGYTWQGDSVTSLEDHLFNSFCAPDHTVLNFSSLILLPNRTEKTTSIYQGGNLVQTEKYVYTGSGQWTELYATRYYVDSLGRATNVVRIDSGSGQSRTLYTADYRGANNYDGELLLSETDANGAQTSYAYDALQRVTGKTITGYGTQPNKIVQYSYDACGKKLSAAINAGSLSRREAWAYDLAGRLTNQLKFDGVDIGISYSADNRTVTTNYPGGISFVYSQYLDRRPKSITGNGTIARYFNYTNDFGLGPYNGGGYPSMYSVTAGALFYQQFRFKTQNLGEPGSQRWSATATDGYGIDHSARARPAGGGTLNLIASVNIYDGSTHGGIFGALNSDGTYTNYDYDVYGNIAFQSMGEENDSASDFDGQTDRRQYTDTSDIELNGSWYRATTNYICLTEGASSKTMQSIHFQQLNGFTGNEAGCAIDYDADTNEIITTTNIERNDDLVTVNVSEPSTSILPATSVYQNNLLISSSSVSIPSPTLYFYDALGRTNQVTDSQGFSSYVTYDPNTGWRTSMTDPAGNTTRYQYYASNQANAGRLECQTDPNGKNTYYAYTACGQLYQKWGDVPYPAEFLYNEYGDLTNLLTYQGGTGWNSSSWPSNPGASNSTCLVYDPASGALLEKMDAKGNAVSYTYNTNTALLLTRSWARIANGANVTVTNLYNGSDSIAEQDYNDGTPSVYFNNYNRVGEPSEIVDASGTNELVYDYDSRLISITCTNGLMAGIAVSNHFNPYYGRDSVSVQGLSSPLVDDFGYDAYGRLGSVSSGNCSATYGYLPNSDLLQNTIFANGSTTVLTTSRSWQDGFRLGSIANIANGATVTSHSYRYDSVDRRTSAQLEDGSTWAYGYNNRNELTSANRSWADGSAVSGQQYGYTYDNVGNRQSASYGGNTNGINLQTISYAVNNLNEDTNILTPGEKEIVGAAYPMNSVSVNGGLADRKGQYFHQEISVANTNAPVWENVTAISGTFTNQGGTTFPANNQTLVYDADGNLSSDGIWNYQWDAENRLSCMTMTNVSGIANSNRLQLTFTYDYMGRRIEKIVSTWNGTSFSPVLINYFVYDGWNLLAVINPELTIQQSFVWGTDLSQTMAQAGGVGGLLMANFNGTNCFPAYDGNGNVTALIDANDLSLAARYDYSPYGQLIRETGPFARQNPFRFSTKFWDDEIGLIYYGNRFYCPAFGRWINRDPGGKQDNVNLYGFVSNNPITRIDRNGDDGLDDLFEDILDYNWKNGMPYADAIDSFAKEVVTGEAESLTDIMTESIGGAISDHIADMVVNPAVILDEGEPIVEMEVNEYNFDENAQRLITNQLESQIAADNMIGTVLGMAATDENAEGGDGDDMILDAALNAAGTEGVDAAEDIYGTAANIEDLY